jgi:hypothetical protein
MKVEFEVRGVRELLGTAATGAHFVSKYRVAVIELLDDQNAAEALAAKLNAREEELAELQAERDRLRAAVESIAESAIGELRSSDGSSTLRYIYREASEALAATALSAKGEGANEQN